MEEKDMLEIVDIRDATEEEIKEYTRKQESPEWQQRIFGFKETDPPDRT